MSITLTIDNRPVSGRAGETILQVAAENGLRIPTLCHLEGLSGHGSCRLCLVEVAGNGKLLPACVTPIREGMEVSTRSARLSRHRRQIIELLLAERNHVCAVCVANGNCELQDLAMEFGVDHLAFRPFTRCCRWIVRMRVSSSTTTAAFSAPVVCESVPKSRGRTPGTCATAAAAA